MRVNLHAFLVAVNYIEMVNLIMILNDEVSPSSTQLAPKSPSPIPESNATQETDLVMKKKTNKKLLITGVFFILLIFIFGSVVAVYVRNVSTNKQDPKPVESSERQLDANSEFARICATEQIKLSDDIEFEKGQVVLGFYMDTPPEDVKSFLENYNLTKIEYSSLDKPTNTPIKWTQEFMVENTITVDEVNSFLSEIRQDPYITEVDLSTFWHTWPMPKEDQEAIKKVQKIDRWGFFAITFADISKSDEFFQKYPQATFFSEGEVGGIFINKINPNKVTILYKADNAMEILQSIRQNIGVGEIIEIPSGSNKTTYEVINGERVSLTETTDKYPVIYIESRVRNQEDTGYLTGLGIHFPSSYYPQDIRAELSKYSQIDVAQIADPEYINTVVIEVPEGQEECWKRELEKKPEIEHSSLNYLIQAY